MALPLIRTLRFAGEWTRGDASLIQEEIQVGDAPHTLPATRYRRRGHTSGPGWILLHGMTRTGRRHPNLVRFARALAASGATVLVPEVGEWVDLSLAPGRTLDAVLAGVEGMEADPGVQGAPGLMGFSFGGPQALRVASDPALQGRLSCVASFGGYFTIHRTVYFLFTGRHEWDGRRYRIQPDPYGRWILVANYLTRIPGHEGDEPVARGLRELAAYAGDHSIDSGDPALDRIKERVGAGLTPEHRRLFRYFAPPAAEDPLPDDDESRLWADRLADAGLAQDPLMALPDRLVLPCPAFLVHGRNDVLIPFSETLRMQDRVVAPRVDVAVTGLFAHSAGDARRRGWVAQARETLRLGRLLTRILGTP